MVENIHNRGSLRTREGGIETHFFGVGGGETQNLNWQQQKQTHTQ